MGTTRGSWGGRLSPLSWEYERFFYGGPYVQIVQYTKENISAQRKLSIHNKNIQYTFQIIDSPKRISIHDEVWQNKEKNIFHYATKSFQMRNEV